MIAEPITPAMAEKMKTEENAGEDLPIEIVRKKMKKNALKYPVEKSKGRSDKYDQL